MKKIIKAFISAACIVPLASGCIQEIEPQSGSVTLGQAAAAPGAYDNFVDAITSSSPERSLTAAKATNTLGISVTHPSICKGMSWGMTSLARTLAASGTPHGTVAALGWDRGMLSASSHGHIITNG